ncbi:LAFA_0A05534g1_1 [Lachancea sp. 'fantastica']|nr:LAFA_0A05534g1_1 [Lachancea sp. 'fantastica']
MEETKKLSSVSERLQLLLRESQDNETHRRDTAPASASASASAWDAVVDTLGKEKLSASEPAEDVNSYYTSFVPHRPYADYFDFDGGQIDVDGPGPAADGKPLSTTAPSTPKIDGEQEPALPPSSPSAASSPAPSSSSSSSSSSSCFPEAAEETVQLVLDRLNTYKDEFRELIHKLDEASLVSSQIANPRRVLELDQRPGAVNSIVSGILGTLQSIQFDTVSRKRSRTEFEASSTDPVRSRIIPARVVDSNKTPALKDVEEDPCYGLANFGVVLIKSPTTVAQLWNEYTKLPSDWALPDWFEAVAQQHTLESGEIRSPAQLMKRRTSIRDLEKRYGSSWRNNDKNFSRQVNRRKKVWLAIEEGLEDGIPLQECFRLLESYVRERGKGLSWYYNGVPFKLLDIRKKGHKH